MHRRPVLKGLLGILAAARVPEIAHACAPTTRDEFIALIGRKAVDVKPELAEYSFTGSTSLVEVGLDSVDRSEVYMLVLEDQGLKVPTGQLYKKTIGELADVLVAACAG